VSVDKTALTTPAVRQRPVSEPSQEIATSGPLTDRGQVEERAPGGLAVAESNDPIVTCSRPSCGAVAPLGTKHCPKCGVWLTANTGPLKDGRYSPRAQQGLLPGQEEIRAVIDEKREAIQRDLGGEAALSAIGADEVSRYLKLWTLAETLWINIEQQGALTSKGRSRAAVTLYLQVSDRLDKLVSRLGLERKARALSFHERLGSALTQKDDSR
jgi:hypothetical protein